LGGSSHRAWAASWGGSSLASRTLTLQLTLGLGTVDWLDALVLAVESLAHWSALGLWSNAGGVATSRLADSLTLWAAVLLAQLLRATNSANRAFAVDGALGTGDLLTLHLALGASAHWVANSRACGIIALPFAHRVALFGHSHSHQQEESNENRFHF